MHLIYGTINVELGENRGGSYICFCFTDERVCHSYENKSIQIHHINHLPKNQELTKRTEIQTQNECPKMNLKIS